MTKLIGWISTICFAFSSVPQAYRSFKDKHSDGISWGLIVLSLIGEVTAIIFMLLNGLNPLFFNYLLSLVFMLIIGYYKIKGRNNI